MINNNYLLRIEINNLKNDIDVIKQTLHDMKIMDDVDSMIIKNLIQRSYCKKEEL